MEENKIKYLINVFQKSDIQASEGKEVGNVPFYTSSQELCLYFSKALFPANSITMGTGGCACVNYSDIPFATSTDCFNFNCNDKCFTKFMFYWIYCQLDKVDDLYFWGMGLKHLQKPMFCDQHIILPPIQQQIEIVKFLDEKTSTIDKLVLNLETQIEQLRKYKISAISEYLQGRTENLYKIKFKNFIIDEKCDQHGLSYFALENLVSNSGAFIETSSNYSSEGAFICKRGDICFGKLRPYLRKFYLVPDDTTCSTEIAVFREKESTKYLYYILQSEEFIQKCNAFSEGTKMPRINIEEIKNWKFYYPNVAERIAFVEKMEKLEKSIETLIGIKQKKINELKLYKKSLIYENVIFTKEVI